MALLGRAIERFWKPFCAGVESSAWEGFCHLVGFDEKCGEQSQYFESEFLVGFEYC